nr:immunoglobulin light chain junction region [Macaca mulatta]MOX35756.1 immunoglobulin light chain junction region [Macaca mulatta]MOX46956.1 immunoglobulin light chain junction region [Macaca mulatta]
DYYCYSTDTSDNHGLF